jgi:hypothetical protein
MNLPGFTTAASLYEPSERYRMRGESRDSEIDSVVPSDNFDCLLRCQQRSFPRCYRLRDPEATSACFNAVIEACNQGCAYAPVLG